jgi:hypothetical protein
MRLLRRVLFDLSGSARRCAAAEDWTDRIDVRSLIASTNLSAVLVRPDGLCHLVDSEARDTNLTRTARRTNKMVRCAPNWARASIKNSRERKAGDNATHGQCRCTNRRRCWRRERARLLAPRWANIRCVNSLLPFAAINASRSCPRVSASRLDPPTRSSMPSSPTSIAILRPAFYEAPKRSLTPLSEMTRRSVCGQGFEKIERSMASAISL